jgi:riboflavin synthase
VFTGIVEEIGTITNVDLANPLQSLVIGARSVLQGTKEGDSIAVNGTCLTVTRLDQQGFAVGVMPETLRRTNLGGLQAGDQVNLERALLPDTRMGGHFVQGHIDGVGAVVSAEPDGEALSVRIEAAPDVLRYIVEKGFIAVDGASLTVTGVDDSSFGIALIPYTQQHIAPDLTRVGHRANLEVDILAKYLEKLLVR